MLRKGSEGLHPIAVNAVVRVSTFALRGQDAFDEDAKERRKLEKQKLMKCSRYWTSDIFRVVHHRRKRRARADGGAPAPWTDWYMVEPYFPGHAPTAEEAEELSAERRHMLYVDGAGAGGGGPRYGQHYVGAHKGEYSTWQLDKRVMSEDTPETQEGDWKIRQGGFEKCWCARALDRQLAGMRGAEGGEPCPAPRRRLP